MAILEFSTESETIVSFKYFFFISSIAFYDVLNGTFSRDLFKYAIECSRVSLLKYENWSRFLSQTIKYK